MDANTTIIIALVTLVLVIFGASWLNQRMSERFLEQLEKRFDAKFDSLEKRFDGVERRLEKIERQLEAIFKPVFPK